MTAPTAPLDDPVPDSLDDDTLAVRETLPIARRSRGATRLTVGLLVMLGISAGFLVGVLLQKHQGSDATASGAGSFAALAQRFAGAGGTAGTDGTVSATSITDSGVPSPGQ